MLTYNIISVICLAYMLGLIGVFFYKLKTSYKGSVEFLRSFKKGSFALIYFVAIPLYTMGYVYANPEMTFINALFNGIAKTSTLVGLRYDVSSVEALIAANPIFAAAVYACFILVAVNAFLLVASLTHQWIKCRWETWQWFHKKIDLRVLIIGNNGNNKKIYESVIKNKKQLCPELAEKIDQSRDTECENKKKLSKKGDPYAKISCMRAIVDKLNDKDSKQLYIDKVTMFSRSRDDDDVEYVLKSTLEDTLLDAGLIVGNNDDKQKRKQKNTKTVIVINTQDDARNIRFCSAALEFINNVANDDEIKKDKQKIVDLFERLPIYVFGNPEHEGIYTNMVENSHGCIHYVNKYKRIAVDFIDKYPMSKFLGDAIDHKTALVRESANINVALIGFGKTNQQIFLTSVANNQFMTENKDKKLELKKVNYRIFDKMYPDNIKNLNHTYYRFKNEMELSDRTKYLPLPSKPANDKYFSFEINCPSFYFILRDFLKTKDSLNYVVICFGTDLENIDMAQKLVEKAQEWKVTNYKIFVKVRSGKSQADIFKNENCFMIGNEKEVAYDIGEITNNKIEEMAKKRDLIYRLEKAVKNKKGAKLTDEERQNVEVEAKYNWYVDLSQIERDSNVYGVLSIRSKLNMMNMDYCAKADAGDKNVIDSDTYTKLYDDEGNIGKSEQFEFGYPENDTSKRGVFAVQEHYRWNSYMISRGLVPATIEDILTEYKTKNGEIVLDENGNPEFSNGKNYKLRRHGNITTMDGLNRFRELVYERDLEKNPEKASRVSSDVIKYDYQILDDACRILNEIGYEVYDLSQKNE